MPSRASHAGIQIARIQGGCSRTHPREGNAYDNRDDLTADTSQLNVTRRLVRPVQTAHETRPGKSMRQAYWKTGLCDSNTRDDNSDIDDLERQMNHCGWKQEMKSGQQAAKTSSGSQNQA